MPHISMTLRTLAVLLTLSLSGCTAEGTLKTLQAEFPERKPQLNELKDLMLSLSDSGKNFRLLSSRMKGGEGDVIDFFEKEGRVPAARVLETVFRSRREQLVRVQQIVHAVGIDYVSVENERKAVWVILEGGGVLASDKGYLYAGGGEIASFHLQRALPIPNETNWYAFD
jgi:hypothetical protein